MATRTIIQSSEIGYTNLFELVANYMGDSTADIDEICKDVIEWVNNNLPDSFFWSAYTSELIAEETEEMEQKEFMGYVTDGIIECAVDHDEDSCSSLTDSQRQDIRKEICFSLMKDTDDAENLYDSPNPEDVWNLDKKLKKQRATVKEYRKAFEDFYTGYIG